MLGRGKNNTDNINSDVIDTMIGHACQITGDISSKSSIRVEGHIDGNVSAEGEVIIAEKGSITGNVKCNELTVYGALEGEIHAKTLHLQPTAKITGDVNTQNLHVEPGAMYQGAVSMTKATDITKASTAKTTTGSTSKPST